MKRYQRKIALDKDYSDGTKATPRKYFNSAERQYAKREIHEVQEALIEDNEIKTRDLYDLQRALDRKLNDIKLEFARTLHNLDIPLVPGGEKTTFNNTFSWRDFNEDYDWYGMSEDELLELLSLSIHPNRTIDINLAIKQSRYHWWND